MVKWRGKIWRYKADSKQGAEESGTGSSHSRAKKSSLFFAYTGKYQSHGNIKYSTNCIGTEKLEQNNVGI